MNRWLFLLLSSACSSDYDIVPRFPVEADVVCHAESESEFVPGTGSLDRWAGRSVQIASSGTAAALPDVYRWMVTGAPGDEANEEVGFVQFTEASVPSGTLDVGSSYNVKFLPPPPFTSTAYQFGWALEAADVRDCYPGSGAGKYDGCGQEVLVGAPDTYAHAGPGQVFWYEPDGDVNGKWQYGGMLAAPGGTPNGSEFGYAIVAAFEPSSSASPWAVGDTDTAWVAISAPDADKVFIYSVSPGSSTPLTLRQTLTAPISARRFGHSMVVGKFDGDSFFDLAVGGPIDNGADKVGRVWVYRGKSNTTWPFVEATPFELDGRFISGGGYSTEANYFGWSVAAGRFVGDVSRDALLIGAPLAGSDDDGGYCQYVLAGTTGSPFYALDATFTKCTTNTWTSATVAGVQEHMGYSVAVGNFQNSDSSTLSDTPEALLEEVAIGRPGAHSGGSADVGYVDVMLTDDDGFEKNLFASVIAQYAGPTAGARFGESSAAGYVQATNWEDLAIGAPEVTVGTTVNGSASLTKASTTAACDVIDGYYYGEDAFTIDLGDEDGPESVMVYNDDTTAGVGLVFVEDFWLALKTDPGTSSEAVCTTDDGPDEGTEPDELWAKLPAGTEISLPGTWGCTDTTNTWVDVDVSALVFAIAGVNMSISNEVTLTLDTTTGALDYAIALDPVAVAAALFAAGYDEACEPAPLSGTLDLDVEGICE